MIGPTAVSLRTELSRFGRRQRLKTVFRLVPDRSTPDVHLCAFPVNRLGHGSIHVPCFGPANSRATVVLGAHMSATVIRIQGDDFVVNGLPACPGAVWEGHRAEGLLLNSRMVQATFDDLNPATGIFGTGRPASGTRTAIRTRAFGPWPTGAPPASTASRSTCKAAVPLDTPRTSRAQLRLWGGRQSRSAYMQRLGRVLAEADALGMAVIVGLFYFGQFHRCRSDDAMRTAVAGAIGWLAESVIATSSWNGQRSGHRAQSMGLWRLARILASHTGTDGFCPEPHCRPLHRRMDSARQYEP